MRVKNALALSCLLTTTAQAHPFPEGFDASALVALSDGAMLASGYIDGRLGPREPDLLTIVTDAGRHAEVSVSNSVALWPNVMALSHDERYAIVTEPFAQPSDDATEFSQIERGSQITVVDLADQSAPQIVQRVTAPGPTAAVDMHPDGSIVAVTLPFEGQIALYPFEGGQLGTPVFYDLGTETFSNNFVPEFKWHPSGDFAAVTLGGADLVVFYRFDGTNLAPWGAPLRTAPLPGKGAWTENGDHFIVTTITATHDMAQKGYGQNASLFAVYEFDKDDVANSPPRRANDRSVSYDSEAIQHARIAHVPAGMGYVENFAISPDGQWIVGLNMVATWLPEGHPGRTTFSELTLFGLDAETGRLMPHSVTRMEDVVLPQGITFDADGSHVAVTSFQHDDRPGGSIAFFRLETTETPRLVPDGASIATPRGAHFLSLID